MADHQQKKSRAAGKKKKDEELAAAAAAAAAADDDEDEGAGVKTNDFADEAAAIAVRTANITLTGPNGTALALETIQPGKYAWHEKWPVDDDIYDDWFDKQQRAIDLTYGSAEPLTLSIAHYDYGTLCYLGAVVSTTPYTALDNMGDYVILHVGRELPTPPGRVGIKDIDIEDVGNLWYLVSLDGKSEMWAILHGNTLRKVAGKRRDDLFDNFFANPIAVAEALAAGNKRTLVIDAIYENKPCKFNISLRYVPKQLQGRLKTSMPAAPKSVAAADIVHNIASSAAAQPASLPSPDMLAAAKAFSEKQQQKNQPPLPPPQPKPQPLPPPPPQPQPQPPSEPAAAAAAPSKAKSGTKRKHAPSGSASPKENWRDVWQEALNLAAASGANCPVSRTSPVTARNILAVLVWMHKTAVPLKINERYTDLPNMGVFMSPPSSVSSSSSLSSSKQTYKTREQWRFAALRLFHDEWHGLVQGETAFEAAVDRLFGSGGGDNDQTCPVAAESPITSANVLALLEWMRNTHEPIDGDIRFGQLRNMSEILKPNDDNHGKTIMYMFDSLRMAYNEWHEELLPKTGSSSFEDSVAVLFS